MITVEKGGSDAMRKRIWCLTAAVLVSLLTGCIRQSGWDQYSVTYLSLFDTVTAITGTADSQEEFNDICRELHDELLAYHRLFDIYNDYPGLTNLKTLNDLAGTGPVEVDEALLALLSDCKTYRELTGGTVDPAMGSVLALWHQARTDALEDPERAAPPAEAALREASLHTAMDAVLLDPENGTAEITDPGLRLDVGAIAKGWAVQRVCEKAPAGLLISVGGNIYATGPKDEAGTPWVVAIQDPRGEGYLHTLAITQGSVVTSGDYQRCFTADDKLYHHIIDPQTLCPGEYWSSVTVVCPDSGLADALSTALFLLPRDQGQALLDRCGATAMWVDREGNRLYSPGFEALILG